jgi:hypothetical protein
MTELGGVTVEERAKEFSLILRPVHGPSLEGEVQ